MSDYLWLEKCKRVRRKNVTLWKVCRISSSGSYISLFRVCNGMQYCPSLTMDRKFGEGCAFFPTKREAVGFIERLQGEFPEYDRLVILKCSGMVCCVGDARIFGSGMSYPTLISEGFHIGNVVMESSI